LSFYFIDNITYTITIDNGTHKATTAQGSG
jgi:hypothetical protein